MNKESFVFYKSFYEAIKNIPDSEQLKLYNAICEYWAKYKHRADKRIGDNE